MGKGGIYTFPVAEGEGGRRVGDDFDNKGRQLIWELHGYLIERY